MIDTGIATHTPLNVLMDMEIYRFMDIRMALREYQQRVKRERDEEAAEA